MRRFRLLLRLALRNVRRQARRSFLTATAIVVSMMLLVFSRALSEGGHEKWISSAVQLGSGHLVFQTPGFQTRRAIEERLQGGDLRAVDSALRDPLLAARVTATTPRIQVAALASSAASALPVAVIGADPVREAAFSGMDRRLVEGRYLAAEDRLHAYVGEALARRLRLQLGDRLVLTAQALDSSITEQLVRVAGTFRTGIPEVDQGLVYIPLRTAQEWLGLEDGVSTIAVLLRDSWSTGRAVTRARSLLASRAGSVAVLSWREASPELDAAIRIDDFGDYVFHAILFLIVALAIVNTVLMSVLARTREFGVVRALGLRKGDSALLVTLETMTLTLVSGVTGAVLGVALTWLFFRNGLDFTRFMGEQFTAAGAVIDPVFVPAFRGAQIVQSFLFVVAIGLLAALYPAFRATRIDITEAMKFEG
jgi:ABC-type lipoprotein release transport system permease subunit